MLIEAVLAVQDQEQESVIDTGDEPDSTDPSGGEISAQLSIATHTAPAVWEYQCSIPYALHVLQVTLAQDSAEGLPPQADPRMRANRALGLCIHRIRERHFKKQAIDG
jgi:hypothetical protein